VDHAAPANPPPELTFFGARASAGRALCRAVSVRRASAVFPAS
jgi:hypothetical protein